MFHALSFFGTEITFYTGLTFVLHRENERKFLNLVYSMKRKVRGSFMLIDPSLIAQTGITQGPGVVL